MHVTKLAHEVGDAQRSLADALFALAELAYHDTHDGIPLRDQYARRSELVDAALRALWLGVVRALREGEPWIALFRSLQHLPVAARNELLAELALAERGEVLELAAPYRRPLDLVPFPFEEPWLRVRAGLVEACANVELVVLSAWLDRPEPVLELADALGHLLAYADIGEPWTHKRAPGALYRELLRSQRVDSGRAPKMRDLHAGTEEAASAPENRADVHHAQLHQIDSGAKPDPADAPRSLRADDLSFTVFRPRALAVNAWTRLLAFAHLSEKRPGAPADAPDPLSQVRAQAQALLGEDASQYREAREDAGQPIPFEGQLTFLPYMPGVEFDPPQHTFRWLTDIHRAEFLMRAAPALSGETARGTLSVYFGAVLVADLTLSIPVVQTAAAPLPAQQVVSQTARLYRKIFASYSHKDTHTVKMFARLVRAFGDDYLIDQEQLRAGQRWSDELKALIGQADVFQLFWSRHSMRSPFVRQEWEYALSLGKPGFVRPTYWETPLPEAPDLPPPALRALHFEKIPYFAAMDGDPAASPSPGSAPRRARKRVLSAGLGALALLFVGIWSLQYPAHPDAVTPARDVGARPDPQPPARIPNVVPEAASPAFTMLHFESEPARAEVFLNGKFVGVTPLALSLASEHARGTVLMTRDGYHSNTTEFDASRKSAWRVRLVLGRREPSPSSGQALEPNAISRPPRALR